MALQDAVAIPDGQVVRDGCAQRAQERQGLQDAARRAARRQGNGRDLRELGLGEGADWWRNICAAPALQITIGSKTFTPEQRFLDEVEAYKLRKLVWKRHPVMSRVSLVTTNYPTPKIDKDFKKWARDMPFVAFRPPTSVEI